MPMDAPVDVRLRRILAPEHPLWPAALLASERLPASRREQGDRVWPAWLRFLDEIGRPPLAATAADVEAYVARFGSRDARTHGRGSLRALYGAAFDLGLLSEMPIPDRVPGDDRRFMHRLSDAEVERLVASLTRTAATPALALRARRDLVLVALACSVDCGVDDLRQLRWGDLGVDDGAASLRVRRGDGFERVALPAVVQARVEDFRAELARRGVDVVAEDALLPALGRRVEWDWTLPERSLLAVLEYTGFNQALKVMRRETSVGRALEGGRFFSHRWLLRSGDDLDRVLGKAPGPAMTKVPMRRMPLDRDPDAEAAARAAGRA